MSQGEIDLSQSLMWASSAWEPATAVHVILHSRQADAMQQTKDFVRQTSDRLNSAGHGRSQLMLYTSYCSDLHKLASRLLQYQV